MRPGRAARGHLRHLRDERYVGHLRHLRHERQSRRRRDAGVAPLQVDDAEGRRRHPRRRDVGRRAARRRTSRSGPRRRSRSCPLTGGAPVVIARDVRRPTACPSSAAAPSPGTRRDATSGVGTHQPLDQGDRREARRLDDVDRPACSPQRRRHPRRLRRRRDATPRVRRRRAPGSPSRDTATAAGRPPCSPAPPTR